VKNKSIKDKYFGSINNLLNINQLKAIRQLLKIASNDIIDLSNKVKLKKNKVTETFLNTFADHRTINNAINITNRTKVKYLEVTNSYS